MLKHTIEPIYIPSVGYDLNFYPYTQNARLLGDYQFNHLKNQLKSADVWHIASTQGHFYILGGTQFIQTVTGILPLSKDMETQKWLIDVVKRRLKIQLSFCDILTLNPIAQLPKDLQFFNLQHINTQISCFIAARSNFFIDLLANSQIKDSNQTTIKKLNIEQIDLRIPIWLGFSQLKYRYYCKLRRGDFLQVQQKRFGLDGKGYKPIGDFMLHMQADDDLYFTQWDNNMEYNDNEHDDVDAFDLEDGDNAFSEKDETQEESTVTTEKHPFANLDVKLSFSLGDLVMSIEDMQHLTEGSLLPLHKPLPAQVLIYANKKPIATGEMVSVNEQLAVRIIDIITHK
jgi:flagellar motor switch/type III secretory pathway protein FliN